jgi:hypothetical protein
LFSRFRIPSRFTIAFALFAVTSAGWMLRDLSRDHLTRPSLKWIVAIACLVAAADIWSQNSRHFEPAFRGAPLDRGFQFLRRPDAPLEDATIGATQGNGMLRAMMSGRAVFQCYEPLKLIKLGDPGLPLASGDGPLLVAMKTFTPNRIDVRIVGGAESSRLLINQNYAPGWRSSLGPVVLDPRYGNLSIAVPPGTMGTYSVSFVPPGLAAGLAIFVAALAISARNAHTKNSLSKSLRVSSGRRD